MRQKLLFIIALCGLVMSASAQEKFLEWYDYSSTNPDFKMFCKKENARATYFIIGSSELTEVSYINDGATRVDRKYKKYSVQDDGSVVYRYYNPSIYPSLMECVVWPDKNVVIEREHFDTWVNIRSWIKESEWEKYPHNDLDYRCSKYNGR